MPRFRAKARFIHSRFPRGNSVHIVIAPTERWGDRWRARLLGWHGGVGDVALEDLEVVEGGTVELPAMGCAAGPRPARSTQQAARRRTGQDRGARCLVRFHEEVPLCARESRQGITGGGLGPKRRASAGETGPQAWRMTGG